MATVYLGIGTNIGDRAANISRAIREISRFVRIFDVSSIYETQPVGFADQDVFWNLAVRGSTALPPVDLLVRLKSIEVSMGRVATFANGPRLIDIDILFYGSAIVEEGSLRIPHPRAMERGFVLKPLADVAGDFVDPVSGVSVSDALLAADLNGITEISHGGAEKG